MRAFADIPCGNGVILAVREDASPPEVHLAPSPGEGPEAIWFHVAIEPGSGGSPRIRCLLHGFENLLGGTLGGGATGLHPVYRTETQDWTRIEQVERVETDDGRILPAWTVPGDAGRVYVALSYPYGQAEVDKLQAGLEGAFCAAPIGVTSGGNPLVRLANQPGSPGSTVPGVYCLARQHAAEAPGSWVLDGFLRHMAFADVAAPLVWAVPFADVDGVLAGSAGKDRFPYDFNRAWGSRLFPEELQSTMGPFPMRHEVRALQTDMLRWRGRCRPCLVLDFHAPTICESLGIYAFVRDLGADGKPDAAHACWTRAFEEALDSQMIAERFVRSGRYRSRWETARVGDFVNQALGVPEVTFETPYGCAGSFIYTRDTYRAAGAQIAEAVLQTMAALG